MENVFAFENTRMQTHLKIRHLTLVTTFWQYFKAVFVLPLLSRNAH
jgi:hypothetical protein